MTDKTPRCTRCGRPLKDPKSITRGMGSECMGKGSSITYKRTVSFSKGEDVSVGKLSFKKEGDVWITSDGSNPISDFDLRKYLIKYKLIDENFIEEEELDV